MQKTTASLSFKKPIQNNKVDWLWSALPRLCLFLWNKLTSLHSQMCFSVFLLHLDVGAPQNNVCVKFDTRGLFLHSYASVFKFNM